MASNSKTPVRVAWATALLSVALGVTLWSANSGAQMPEDVPIRPRTALKTAHELYRRGDYENADRFYQQALAGQKDLSETERQDLAKLAQQNSVALKARRDGAFVLKQAQDALQNGKPQDAREFLKAANANQYLAPTDKQILSSLNERVRGAGLTTTISTGPAGKNNAPATKNSAAAVDTGIVLKGTDAKSYLTAARQALDKGELDFADALVKDAEQAGSSFSWMPWGDSPAKVRRDIQAARAKQPVMPMAAQTPEKNTPSTMAKVTTFFTPPWMRDKKTDDKTTIVESNVRPPDFPTAPKETTSKQLPAPIAQDLGPAAAPSKTVVAATTPKAPVVDPVLPPAPKLPPAEANAKARKLIDDGYRALQANDLNTARRCAEQAKALRPDLEWNERNPDRLLAEVQRKAGTATAAAAPSKNAPPPADARALVKQAKALLQQEKLDEAEKVCAQAAQAPGAHWGLFEDTPESLRRDIQEARIRVNRDKSKQLMVDARKLYNDGNLQEAKNKAWQAQQLHGPYTVWDFGDRPQKLLDDIARAETGGRKAPVLPKDNAAPRPPELAKNNPVLPVPNATPRSPITLASTNNQAVNRQRAVLLIAEARELERGGFLVEARSKAVEADGLGVQFGPEEDSPRNVLLSLASKTDQRIQQLLHQATEFVQNNPNDPTRFDKAELNITSARKLAQSFGLDQSMINQRVQWLQEAAAKNGKLRPIEARNVDTPGLANADYKTPAEPQFSASRQRGNEILDQARLEIKAGNYTLARRIAEEAYKPSYGVQSEAALVLRTIDAEEYLHQSTQTAKNYEAGLEAFHRKEFARAAQLWDTVDVRLLPPDKQRRLSELMQDARSGGPVIPAVAAAPNGPAGGPPGTAIATDQGTGKSLFERYAALEEVQTQKLRERSLDAMNNAMKLAQDKKLQQAVDSLKEFLDQLKTADVNPDRVASIRRQVETKMNQYNTLLAQEKLYDEALAARSGNSETGRNKRFQKIHDEVAKLMNDARSQYKEGQYEKALVAAKQAKELDHDNLAADALINMCNTKVELQRHELHKAENEKAFVRNLDDNQGPHVDLDDPLKYDSRVYQRAKNRKAESISWHSKDSVERKIEQKLEEPQNLYWKDTPLSQVIEDLRVMTGINIVPDTRALREAGVSLDMPMSVPQMENIKLKSGLNILLREAKLTYVVRDQALNITTESEAKGKLKQIIHPVADLVVPVENHQTSEVQNLNSALMRHIQRSGNLNYGGAMPSLPPMSLPPSTGLPVGHYGNEMPQPQATTSMANGFMPNPNTKLLPGQTMENLLMDLIKSTVATDTWRDSGGPATVQFYPLGMALVVNQTLEVQEEVAALLNALRRLQDLEVAIEMRMVSVSEAFFERMGLDFDINIKTPHSRNESQLLSGQFAPFGSVNRNLGVNNVVSGLTPAGTLTPDLNIPIKSSSYDFTIPPFGGFPGTFGSDGGLSLGLAFLNDIQVFMFLEAASGDRRTNVMQAPKITVFNGQVATLSIVDQQFFLTDVQVAVPSNGNQLFFIPNQQPFPIGVNLTVTPVVSADRRFVRINLSPSLTNLASAVVPLFPVQVVVPQFFDGPGSNSSTNTQPQVFQTFFQQPTFTTITLNTTVNVPDGGTVLLGGLKTLSEARNEFGPPILSKIPYLNRLFRNIGYGREAQSLMIMVTPRIIINEEEEQVLFGQATIPRP